MYLMSPITTIQNKEDHGIINNNAGINKVIANQFQTTTEEVFNVWMYNRK